MRMRHDAGDVERKIITAPKNPLRSILMVVPHNKKTKKQALDGIFKFILGAMWVQSLYHR